MIERVSNYREMTLGGRSSFWEEDARKRQIPVQNNGNRIFFAYALRTVARIILALVNEYNDSKKAQALRSPEPNTKFSVEAWKEIKEIEDVWSETSSVLVNLWRRLQGYWKVLPQKATAGNLAVARRNRNKVRGLSRYVPTEPGMTGMYDHAETASETNTTPGEIADIQDEGFVCKKIRIGQLQDILAAVYTPITDVDGCFSTDDPRDCSESMREIARRLGLGDEDQDMLCGWALPLVREQSALCKDTAVEALLGAFHEASLGKLPSEREWPQFRSGVDEKVNAWIDIGKGCLDAKTLVTYMVKRGL